MPNPPPALLEALIQRHQSELLAYLVRLLGDRQDAEDALQEMWLRAHRALPRLRPDSQPRAWLYKIASRTAFTLLKRRGRERARQAEVDLEHLAAPAPAETDQLAAVKQVVEALPPRQRAALMQRLFQGLSYAEIAATLGGTPEAARANVYQALKKLRARLQEES